MTRFRLWLRDSWIGAIISVAILVMLSAGPAWAQVSRMITTTGVVFVRSASGLVMTGPIKLADGTAAAPSMAFASDPTTGIHGGANLLRIATGGTDRLAISTTALVGGTNISLGLNAGTGTFTAPDVTILADASNTLAQRNGTNAQTFRVYNTFTDASNYERFSTGWIGNTATFLVEAAGTGTTTRPMVIGTTGAGDLFLRTSGTNIWKVVGATGHLVAVTDNTYDIGASGANRARDVYSARAFVSGGTGLAVANVGANSCGTTAATIAGGNNAFVITVGATSGTQCRVTFTVAAATEWDCTVTDSTTTIATRATPVDTTHTDFFGAFVAADKVTGVCFPR